MLNNTIEEHLSEALGKGLRSNIVLRDYTSFKVGGVADYFYKSDNVDNLVLAITTAIKLNIPYIVIGGGYNIVVSDIGFPGLVIKNESKNLVFLPESNEVIADSGLNLGTLLTEAASRDLGGLEYLFGVPGTVGGAIYGNAGAHGGSIGEHVKHITILIPNKKSNDYKIVKYKGDWLDFQYRQSKLKVLNKGIEVPEFRPIILTARLRLTRSKSEIILDRMRKYLTEKKNKQPLGQMSAGSFFKNPGEQKEQSAGFLLEKVGAKRIHIGKACVSKKHANFIINRGGAKAQDIRRLAEQLKIRVRDDYRINLEEEIEYVGRW